MVKRRNLVGAISFGIMTMLGIGAPSGADAQSGQDTSSPTEVSMPDELEMVLRGYEEAWQSRDPVALADLFTPDGFVLRPGAPPAQGREAILQAYANAGGPLSLHAYAYQVEGDVGYIIGGWSSAPDRPAVGKFVLALRRGESGAWLIAADIDNGN